VVISANFVTKEQIDKAREVGILEYLDRHEPHNLIKVSPVEWKLIDHDSLRISNGKFHWFSRGIGGINALDYLIKVRGLDFKEAVVNLVGGDKSIPYKISPHLPREPTKVEKEKKPFALPTPNSHNRDVIQYLKNRGIDEDIINTCIENKTIYQNRRYGCVFVGYDSNNEAKYAGIRGIKSDYKGEIESSQKKYGFKLSATNRKSKELCIFESAIDALSHATISKMLNINKDPHRLSLGSGATMVPIYEFLSNNKNINHIYICTDRDSAGDESISRIVKQLKDSENYKHIKLTVWQPSIGKDFNEMLVHMKKQEKQEKNIVKQVEVEKTIEPKESVKQKNRNAER